VYGVDMGRLRPLLLFLLTGCAGVPPGVQLVSHFQGRALMSMNKDKLL
jgi:starvation-inducible outer membrane lipoprotein